MSPAQKISEIKVLHTGGMNGGGMGGGGMGAITPILSTLMQAGAAYPVMRELMAFGGLSPEAIVGELKGLLASEAEKPAEAATASAPSSVAPTAEPPSSTVSDGEVVFVEELTTESGEHPAEQAAVPAGTPSPHLPTGVASAA